MKNNTLIIGDSYSTFKGYIPEKYAFYYAEPKSAATDVSDVSHTWWFQVMKEANLNLVLNNSWSGSTIGYTGYNNSDCSKTSSFIYRLKELIENEFFNKHEIHKVFVFGGTNDSWSNAPLGESTFEIWSNESLYCVLPAISYFLNLLKETLPNAEIYCLINTGIKPEIVSCLLESCERYNITPVTFDCIDKECGHPTIQGMKDIRDGVMNVLNK